MDNAVSIFKEAGAGGLDINAADARYVQRPYTVRFEMIRQSYK